MRMPFISVFRKATASGCRGEQQSLHEAADKLIIVGPPNVGKSALFNRLTGRYVTVSNYPGTTVEIAKGLCKLPNREVEVVDTPGMYSLLPITDEERVARDMLFQAAPAFVLHVIDAKNIERMLGLTLQMSESGLPVVLVLNMFDEAKRAGIRIDCRQLESILGFPVVPTVATTGEGVQALMERLAQPASAPPRVKVNYGSVPERAIADISARIEWRRAMAPRTRAILLLQGDADETDHLLEEKGKAGAEPVLRLVRDAAAELGHPPQHDVAAALKANVDEILGKVAMFPGKHESEFADRLDRLCLSPWTGIPLLVLVLYFGVYQFVGKFGAGVCVDFVEHHIFEHRVNPWVDHAAEAIFPWPVLAALFAGDFGIITLGIRYAVAIILPIVGTFFIAFSILEDSGYLPRLALLIDRVFKKIGLNGRAVIPLVLGLGCDTMATMVTRTLETKRERIIATILLALAIPCSAQMGVIIALLAGTPYSLLIWTSVVGAVFLLVGMLAARIMPGERPVFYIELPPLRFPKLGNVLIKTYTRIAWYFKEVLPMFIVASILIWVGRVTGGFQLAVSALEPVVRWIGLPTDAAVALLFGFFRRDYGSAGLYDLQKHGLLTGNQLVVAAITLTLFLPCIAQFLMMKKEHGIKLTLSISAFIVVLAFGVGFSTNTVLNILGIAL